MSFSRRQVLRVAATSSAAGLAGCQGLIGQNDGAGSGDIEAEASVGPTLSREGEPILSVTWTVNKNARYLSVAVENVSTGQGVETALCGVGATVQYNGASGQAGTNGPVGSPPDCESGSASGLAFDHGDELSVTVTAHASGDRTEELVAQEFTFPTPTPTPSG